MATGNTFEFNQDDYDKIILKESLFGDGSIPTVATEVEKKTLKDLLDRETRLFLHAVTLSDYLRQKRIPRGLRIQKAPTIGQNSPSFRQRWCDIMNKCSFDLMVLVVQETTEQLTDVRGKIKETREKMEKDFIDKAALRELVSECERYKEKLENDIKDYKRKKFRRDIEDYEKNKIYKWTFENPKKAGKRRFRSYQRGGDFSTGFSTAGETSDSDAYNSEASTTSSSFLDGRTHTGAKEKPPYAKRGRGGGRGRGRNAGEARGYEDQTTRTTRSARR